MRARSLSAASAAALVVAALAAPPAHAAIAYAPCQPVGFECGRLPVPVDRAGAVPGTITLSITRTVAAANPTRTAVVALAGGPGQAAVPVAPDFATILAPALATRDLVVYDQRGTGGSNRLRCAAFESGGSPLVRLAGSCAAQLGPARGFFRTAESVDDIESLRAESGYEKLVLFGVSYGTKVALDYAAKYPARVESLVLDSIVPPEGSDVFNRSTFAATGRALGELCSAGACAGISSNPVGDLARLVDRTDRRALHGTINDAGGRRLRVSLTPLGLFEILLGGDLNPTLRAELPGSLRSALRGDLRPILRLRARAAGLSGVPTGASVVPTSRLQDDSDGSDSDALFAATRCEESTFPWDRAAGPEARAKAATAAARLLPREQLGPWNADIAVTGEAIPLCVGWPNASAPLPAPGPLPAVPTLLLDGNADLRTPLEDAVAVAGRVPGAYVVGVPYTGHSVLGSDRSTCATAAVATFFAGQPVSACAPVAPTFAPTPVAPTRLSRLPGPTNAARTVAALRATLRDVRRQFIGDAVASGQPTRAGARVGGLRSGTARWRRSGIRLTRVQFVPGVVVSGFLRHGDDGTGSFSVGGGSAARGSVRLGADGRITGRLGGRRISALPAAGAADAAATRRVAGPAWPERLPRHPRLAGLR